MHVALLRLDLQIEGRVSLRQKRQLIRAILDKLHDHFNVSAAEVDHHERADLAGLAVAAVGRSRRDARVVLEHVAEAVGAHPQAELIGSVINDL